MVYEQSILYDESNCSLTIHCVPQLQGVRLNRSIGITAAPVEWRLDYTLNTRVGDVAAKSGTTCFCLSSCWFLLMNGLWPGSQTMTYSLNETLQSRCLSLIWAQTSLQLGSKFYNRQVQVMLRPYYGPRDSWRRRIETLGQNPKILGEWELSFGEYRSKLQATEHLVQLRTFRFQATVISQGINL
jgi:hypothetical protein